jgi:hypothetical protein
MKTGQIQRSSLEAFWKIFEGYKSTPVNSYVHNVDWFEALTPSPKPLSIYKRL